ncbi:MAG: GvpL/GvpF family gas vesicle protein [Bryobacteraceae bacterium]|jgi:hypothetical protein
MKYLLHGVMRQNPGGWLPELGMRVLTAHGLAAAVSAVEDISPPPSISRLLAYEKVVEAIHARQAVIPLRYGCVMESESAVIRLLEDHRQEYDALLTRLLGMTEIAIRALWPARDRILPGLPSSPGAAYLASLRACYNSAIALAPEEAQLADQITSLLSDCSTEQRREVSSSGRGLIVSLYFLTPAADANEFLRQARQIRPPSAAKLLLSGPWPPYNFAASVDGI